MTDGTGASSYTYDTLDRLTHLTNGHGDSVSYAYDLANNQTSITYPNTSVVTRLFDADERLASIKDWLGNTTSFAYDPDSNLTTTTFPASTGNLDTTAFDNADRPLNFTTTQGSTTVASISYQRDNLGQVANESDAGLPGAGQAYGYNSLEQLSQAGSSAYAYDNSDNATQIAGTGGYGYDNAHELTGVPAAGSAAAATLTYDTLGERTTNTPTSGPATSYGYDQAGNLTSVSRPAGSGAAISDTYSYNGTGLRQAQSDNGNTTQLAWDTSGQLPALLASGTISFIDGPGGVPIEQIGGSTPVYLHHDQIGSTRLLTDASGNSVGTFSYDADGNLTGSTGTATTALGYAGQYTDSDTGLVYMRARYYDPSTGQFLTRDPLQALTRQPYSYAYDNPTNGTDPSGLLTIGLCVSGTSILGEVVGITGTACAQASSSGDVGVTLTGGGVVGGGTPDLSGGVGVEVTNANHISQLGGWFAQAGGEGALGAGGYGDAFVGRDSCGNQIVGGQAGPAAGIGVAGQVGPTYTVPISISLPSIFQGVVHAVGSAWNAINPF